ncbi:uncharacterized protein HD556DRAFT_1532390, partial [Suillus plorans]
MNLLSYLYASDVHVSAKVMFLTRAMISWSDAILLYSLTRRCASKNGPTERLSKASDTPEQTAGVSNVSESSIRNPGDLGVGHKLDHVGASLKEYSDKVLLAVARHRKRPYHMYQLLFSFVPPLGDHELSNFSHNVHLRCVWKTVDNSPVIVVRQASLLSLSITTCSCTYHGIPVYAKILKRELKLLIQYYTSIIGDQVALQVAQHPVLYFSSVKQTYNAIYVAESAS